MRISSKFAEYYVPIGILVLVALVLAQADIYGSIVICVLFVPYTGLLLVSIPKKWGHFCQICYVLAFCVVPIFVEYLLAQGGHVYDKEGGQWVMEDSRMTLYGVWYSYVPYLVVSVAAYGLFLFTTWLRGRRVSRSQQPSASGLPHDP